MRFGRDAVTNLAGANVTSATLQLRNYGSASCKASTINAARITSDWTAGAVTWNNQPDVAGAPATYDPAWGFSSACASNWATWDVTNIVSYWSDNPSQNYGIRLKAADETDLNSMRLYRSLENTAGTGLEPSLTVTYAQVPPTTPSKLNLTPCLDDCDPNWSFADSLTPALHATSVDPDSPSLTYMWQIRDDSTETVLKTQSTTAASGTPASWTVPAGVLNDNTLYDFRVQASDGTSAAWSDWSTFGVDVDQAPDVPTDLGLSPCQDPCTTLSTTSLTPMVFGSVSDPDDGDDIQAAYELRKAGTTTVLSTDTAVVADGEQPQFSVPAGAITTPGTYEYRIGATDPSDSTTWSAWTPFTVTAAAGPAEPTLSLNGCEALCDSSPWVAPSATPTLEVKNNANVATTLRIEFQTQDGSSLGTVVSGVAAAASTYWAVPAAQLGHGLYSVRAGAGDGDAVTWTAWQEITVDSTVDVGDSPALDTGAIEGGSTLPTADPAANNEDLNSGTFTQADLDALDAQIAAQEATPQGVASEEADSADNFRPTDPAPKSPGISIPAKYAPEVELYPGEPFYPIGAKSFINNSSIQFWYGDECGARDLHVNPTGAGLKAGDYEPFHTMIYAPTCVADNDSWKTNQHVRPFDDDGPPKGQGITLHVLNDSALHGFRGKKVGTSVATPVYVDYVSKNYIVYWFLYGDNAPQGVPASVVPRDHHQGDWEHISIKLNSQNKPKYIVYASHGGPGCSLPWSEVVSKGDQYDNHPYVWSALGTHASYPPHATNLPHRGVSHVSRLQWHEKISGNGQTWFTNQQLLWVKNQDWYGYGGGWGRGGVTADTSGPLGPSPWKTGVPDGNVPGKCQVSN